MAGFCHEFDGEKRFVILTKDANKSMEEVHHRMPVILSKEHLYDWVFDSQSTKELMESASPLLEKVAV